MKEMTIKELKTMVYRNFWSDKSIKYYAYLLPMRPVGIGTQPSGIKEHVNFDNRVWIPELETYAWGIVWYDHPLKDKEMREYELRAIPDWIA